MLYHNPPEIKDISGYFWVILKDKSKLADMEIGSFSLPVEGLVPFQPLHLELVVPHRNQDQPSMSFYLTICLEKPIKSSVDCLTYVAINWASFHPNPTSVKRFAIALVTDPKSQSLAIPYVQLDLARENSVA